MSTENGSLMGVVIHKRIDCNISLFYVFLYLYVYLYVFCICMTHLHGQTDGVEKDECEHQVFKVGGIDHIPHLVLVGVLRDVATQWTGLQGIFHTLTL